MSLLKELLGPEGHAQGREEWQLKMATRFQVTVPMANVNKILYEKTIPGDWVMLKPGAR